MDRKSWIIIALCAVLLGADYYYSSTQPKPPVAPQSVSQPATKTASADAASNSPALPGDMAVVPPVDESKLETWPMVSYAGEGKDRKPVATYSIANIGGSIRNVEMEGDLVDSRHVPDVDVKINENGTYGIGTLVFGITPAADPSYDTSVYSKVDSESNDEKLTLVARLANGLAVKKEYTFDPLKDENGALLAGSQYMLKLKITLFNPMDHAVRLPDMGVFAGAGYPIAKSEMAEAFTHFFYMTDGKFVQETPSYFTGGFISSAKPREVANLVNLTYGGVMSQYYASILIPAEDSRGSMIYAQRQLFHLKHEGDHEVPGVILAMGAPVVDLQPKAEKVLSYEIYAGPKKNQVLNELPYKLDEVMAYGWLTILSAPMNWLLNFFFGLVGNWGIAIICMTIVVRIVIWPLYKKSYMAMKRMSLVQPKMQELKEKYPNDPQKVNVEMMKMYQEYGINPASGCLPMLIQIPIFFAFYRVLQYSAELRGQPFFWWVKDLSLPDTVYEIPLPFSSFPTLPVNILPLIMAVTMVIQMKMTPQAGDKMQRRIMAFMPLVFFFFCYNFASALALYWTAQNLINMGQTLLIRRLPQPELTKTKKKKAGFLQRMMEQQRILAEQQKQQGGGMRNVTPGRRKK